MMKSFFKKLAFVMALAMVVSMVAPAGSALAAEAGVSLQGTKTIVETYELDKVGATVDFSFQGAPKDWKTTFKWTSSNEAVATVDKAGVVTAVAAGTATITITAGADASYAETVKVTVKEAAKAMEVAQVNTNTVTLTFAKAPKEADLAAGLAFNMVIADVAVTLPVNTVKVKDNVATVTVFSTFVDGEEYSFVYGNDTATFVASVGEIDRVEFSYYTGNDPSKNVGVAYVSTEDEDFETHFVPKLFDANGVDITAKYDLDDDLDITYALVNDDDSIELDEDEGVISFEKVTAAAVKMTVAWEDEDAEEYTREFTNVVVAQKLPDVAVEFAKAGFVKAGDFIDGAMADFTTNPWGAFWNGTIGLSENVTLPAGGDYQFAALFNDNRGNKVVTGADYGYGEFSFKSSNDDVLDIDEDGELNFYEPGSAYILIYFTPDTDEEEAKPVFVGSKKLTVYPENYATSFKVVNTSIQTSTDALKINAWDTDDYNRVCFEVQVFDQNGNKMWNSSFADLFEVEAVKEDNTVTLESPTFDWGSATYKFFVDGDLFELEEGKSYQKYKYELSIDKTADISKKITTKPVTLTIKVEDNATDAGKLAAFLAEGGFSGVTAPEGVEAATNFNIEGLKGGYGVDLVVKQTANWKNTGDGTKTDVKLGWANGIKYVDSDGYKLAPVPAAYMIEKSKDTTTGEAGKVYYTVSAPQGAITYNDDKTVASTTNWAYQAIDGGILFSWNSSTIAGNWWTVADDDFGAYATPGTYSVTLYTVKKDGGKLYEKGSYSFNVSNSQTLPTYVGFNPDYSNYTDLDITNNTTDLDEVVMKHLVFNYNGAKLDSESDWNNARVSIDWANSDYSVIEGEKLRIKKLCIVAPIDDANEDHYFSTVVTVGKNIYAED
jgi:hypothetical protein